MQAYRQGAALYQAGRYAEAITFWQRALELGEREFGPNHPQTATFFNNLAELYRAQGNYAKVEPLHKRALAIREKALGAEHPAMATSLNNLARISQTHLGGVSSGADEPGCGSICVALRQSGPGLIV